MRLRILGSGTPRPSTRRACSSYLIEVDGDRILFDHGFGASQRLLELGVAPQSISHVFLTHHHYDHIGDLPRLILTRWDQQRDSRTELEIFGPPPIRGIVEQLVGTTGAFATDLAARINSQCSRDLFSVRGGAGDRAWPEPKVTELKPGDRVNRERWAVSGVEAVHCPGDLNCLAYRIDADGQSIVYSGDTGPSRPVADLAQDCDILVFMCSQESGRIATPAIAESCIGHREVATIATEARAGKLVLTHIEHLDNADTRSRVLGEIGDIYDGEVVVAEDLMVFDLDAGAVPDRGAAQAVVGGAS